MECVMKERRMRDVTLSFSLHTSNSLPFTPLLVVMMVLHGQHNDNSKKFVLDMNMEREYVKVSQEIYFFQFHGCSFYCNSR